MTKKKEPQTLIPLNTEWLRDLAELGCAVKFRNSFEEMAPTSRAFLLAQGAIAAYLDTLKPEEVPGCFVNILRWGLSAKFYLFGHSSEKEKEANKKQLRACFLELCERIPDWWDTYMLEGKRPEFYSDETEEDD